LATYEGKETMSYDPRHEFYIPGTFDPTETWPENEQTLHQGGLDRIAPAFDPNTLLTGAIGVDPYDTVYPTGDTQLEIERKQLPQWGPPFVKFVDDRITELEKKVIEKLEKWQFETQTYYAVASLNTDASGNIGNSVQDKSYLITPPPGWTVALHRIGIFVDGSTFGQPFTAANAYWTLRIGNEDIEGGSMVSTVGSLPVVRTWGTRDALRIRDGEIMTLFMSLGPASKRVTVKMQGSVDRTIEG
jgi:hypothetical protein